MIVLSFCFWNSFNCCCSMSAVALADSDSLVALDIWALSVATACSIFFCAWSAFELNSVVFFL